MYLPYFYHLKTVKFISLFTQCFRKKQISFIWIFQFFFQDEGSRGSAAVVPQMVSRSSSSHEVAISVSGRGQSPEPEVTQSIPEASMSRLEQQQQVPIGSVAIVRKHI